MKFILSCFFFYFLFWCCCFTIQTQSTEISSAASAHETIENVLPFEPLYQTCLISNEALIALLRNPKVFSSLKHWMPQILLKSASKDIHLFRALLKHPRIYQRKDFVPGNNYFMNFQEMIDLFDTFAKIENKIPSSVFTIMASDGSHNGKNHGSLPWFLLHLG
jgi:hypothetical protein